MNSQQYHQQVALLIRIMPSVYRIKEFAVHGGTAINLFHQDMPRYSVDIDLSLLLRGVRAWLISIACCRA